QQWMNRPLYSRHLAAFTFWTILLFATWSGIPSSAPVPAWIPSLSTVGTVLTVITALAVMINVRKSCQDCSQMENPAAGKFVAFGTMSFVLAWVLNAVSAAPGVNSITNLTWF